MIDEVAKNFTAIGGGVINWKVLLPAAQEAGGKHFFSKTMKPRTLSRNLTTATRTFRNCVLTQNGKTFECLWISVRRFSF